MSITDELREFAPHLDLGKVALAGWKEGLLAIADRIDAEHQKQVTDAFTMGVIDGIDMAEHSTEYVKLPVDADGVPIHVGDVMDGTCPSGKHVNGTVSSIGDGVFWLSNVQFSLKPDYMHHYHAPTVEDVLREMLDGCDGQNADFRAQTIAEYAKRLTLAGDAE